MQQPFKHLTVVGLGLIGGSFAKAARKAFPNLHIEAVDTDSKVIEKAISDGTIDNGYALLPTEFKEGHLIVLACHISGCLETLEILAPLVQSKNIIVTDISSCKRAVCELGEKVLPEQFIGGHPMAGRAHSGYEYALDELFDGKLFIMCPPNKLHSSPQLNMLTQFITELHMATKIMDPVTHDRVVAHVSHFPQLYALLVTNLLHDTAHGQDMLQCHGGALADQLRLAASPHSMWGEVFKYNKDNLQEVLESFAGLLVKASSKIDDSIAMEKWFEHANYMHDTFAESRKNMAYDPFQTTTTTNKK